MAKIIQINEDIISIGLDNGGIAEVRSCDLNFVANVGDEVEVFQTETKTIVSKKEPVATVDVASGININVSNNTNTADGTIYVANGKAVNKVAYVLLALFLGGLGGHKFYAGKTGTGILFVLFCWTYVPSIIAFIDFIIGLCKPADANGRIII